MSAQIEAFFVWILLVCVVWHRKNAALKSVLFCTITWKGFRIKQLHYLNTILCFIAFSAQDRLTNTKKPYQTSQTKHARLVTQNMLDQSHKTCQIRHTKHARLVTQTHYNSHKNTLNLLQKNQTSHKYLHMLKQVTQTYKTSCKNTPEQIKKRTRIATEHTRLVTQNKLEILDQSHIRALVYPATQTHYTRLVAQNKLDQSREHIRALVYLGTQTHQTNHPKQARLSHNASQTCHLRRRLVTNTHTYNDRILAYTKNLYTFLNII